MTSLDTLSLFCRIIDAGSLSAVARDTQQTPSQVSRQLQALEATVGQRLLDRSTRHLRLTEAGQRYLPHARKMLREQQAALDALDELKGSPRGWLRVAAPEYFGTHNLAPWLAQFQEQYPDLHIELHLADERLDLGKQSLDLAIRMGFPADSAGWYRRFGRYPRVLCGSPAYLARFGCPEHPDDLARHRLVLHSATPNEEWFFSRQSDLLMRQVHPWTRCNSGSAMLQFVLAGTGLGRLTPWMAQELLDAGRLVPVLNDWALVSEHGERASFYAVYPEREPPFKTRLLLDFLGERLNQAPFSQ